MKNLAQIFSICTAILCVALSCAGLLFRATIYWTIPIAEGDPYGFADILEVFIYFGVVMLSGLTILCSLVLCFVPPCKDVKLGIKIFIAGLGSLAAYLGLHQYVPKLM